MSAAQMLGVLDEVTAMQVNLTCAAALLVVELKANRDAAKKLGDDTTQRKADAAWKQFTNRDGTTTETRTRYL